MRFTIFAALLICLSFSSCRRIQSYINTEKELKAHYDTLSFKPQFEELKLKSENVYAATFGVDSLQPIIFIHGAPGRWDGFMKQLDDTSFHSKFHLIAPDRPGYGRSFLKKKYKRVEVEKQAEMLGKLTDLNKSSKKAILVGRSYGAPIAAYMAFKEPEKYEKLIMLSPAIDPDHEKFFKFSRYGKWYLIRWFLPKRLNTATDEKYAHVAEMSRIKDIWSELKVPVVTLYGGNDWVVGPEHFEYAKKKIGEGPSKKYVFIPDAGHRISRSHPDILKKWIYMQF